MKDIANLSKKLPSHCALPIKVYSKDIPEKLKKPSISLQTNESTNINHIAQGGRDEKENRPPVNYKTNKRKNIPFKSRKKIKGVLGKIYCNSTKNNTILSLIDTEGNTKGWSCSGSLGFKNARKSTTYAAQAAAESIIKKAKVLGYTHLRLRVKGLGRGKQSCLRALSKSGLRIISLEDKTPLPYNGCRNSKKRRV